MVRLWVLVYWLKVGLGLRKKGFGSVGLVWQSGIRQLTKGSWFGFQ